MKSKKRGNVRAKGKKKVIRITKAERAIAKTVAVDPQPERPTERENPWEPYLRRLEAELKLAKQIARERTDEVEKYERYLIGFLTDEQRKICKEIACCSEVEYAKQWLNVLRYESRFPKPGVKMVEDRR